MSELHAGELVELVGEGIDDRGSGVAPLGEHDVHVAGLLPGERASACIEHVSVHRAGGRREAWARLQVVTEPSPERVAPVCPAHGPCGGCPLQHLAYPAQVRWKGQQVAETLAAHPALAGVLVSPCVPSPLALGYRNQAKYVYGPAHHSGRLVLGAYAPRSHDIVDLTGCQVVEPPIDHAAGSLRDLLEAHGVPPFDEIRRTGLLRYVIVRANAAGQVLVALVAGRPEWPGAEALAAALQARAPQVTGVVLNVNESRGNALFGGEDRLLGGVPTLEDRVGPARVELHARSFFQLNRGTAGRAYADLAAAAAALGPITRAVDAYAGAGGIAFSLLPHAREVVALEENAAATAAATDFATRGGLPVRFLTGDAAALIGQIADAQLVVLNPPRAGCAPAVLAAVGRLRPRLVAYLSCNPITLARDLELLAKHGLVTAEVRPYDMLPHTPHVEALALLSPRASR
jgi:23S rRNA (uracil1939-C5)-methyltransferase